MCVFTGRAQEEEINHGIRFTYADTIISGYRFSFYEMYFSPVTDSSVFIYIQSDGVESGNGKIIGFYEGADKVYCLGEKNNGQFSGHWISWYVNGRVESEGKFNHSGLKKGEWKWYFDDGGIKGEAAFVMRFTIFNLVVPRYFSCPVFFNEYYRNGTKKINYVFEDGWYREKNWYDNGQLRYSASRDRDTLEYYTREGVRCYYALPGGDVIFNDEVPDSLCIAEGEWPPFVSVEVTAYPVKNKIKF